MFAKNGFECQTASRGDRSRIAKRFGDRGDVGSNALPKSTQHRFRFGGFSESYGQRAFERLERSDERRTSIAGIGLGAIQRSRTHTAQTEQIPERFKRRQSFTQYAA